MAACSAAPAPAASRAGASGRLFPPPLFPPRGPWPWRGRSPRQQWPAGGGGGGRSGSGRLGASRGGPSSAVCLLASRRRDSGQALAANWVGQPGAARCSQLQAARACLQVDGLGAAHRGRACDEHLQRGGGGSRHGSGGRAELRRQGSSGLNPSVGWHLLASPCAAGYSMPTGTFQSQANPAPTNNPDSQPAPLPTHLGLAALDAARQCLGREAAKHNCVHRADARARQLRGAPGGWRQRRWRR